MGQSLQSCLFRATRCPGDLGPRPFPACPHSGQLLDVFALNFQFRFIPLPSGPLIISILGLRSAQNVPPYSGYPLAVATESTQPDSRPLQVQPAQPQPDPQDRLVILSFQVKTLLGVPVMAQW